MLNIAVIIGRAYIFVAEQIGAWNGFEAHIWVLEVVFGVYNDHLLSSELIGDDIFRIGLASSGRVLRHEKRTSVWAVLPSKTILIRVTKCHSLALNGRGKWPAIVLTLLLLLVLIVGGILSRRRCNWWLLMLRGSSHYYLVMIKIGRGDFVGLLLLGNIKLLHFLKMLPLWESLRITVALATIGWLLAHFLGKQLRQLLRNLEVQTKNILLFLGIGVTDSHLSSSLRLHDGGCVTGCLTSCSFWIHSIFQMVRFDSKLLILLATSWTWVTVSRQASETHRFEHFDSLHLDSGIDLRFVILVVTVLSGKLRHLLWSIDSRLALRSSGSSVFGWFVFILSSSRGAFVLSASTSDCLGSRPVTLVHFTCLVAFYLFSSTVSWYVHSSKQICLQLCHILLVVEASRIRAPLSNAASSTLITEASSASLAPSRQTTQSCPCCTSSLRLVVSAFFWRLVPGL